MKTPKNRVRILAFSAILATLSLATALPEEPAKAGNATSAAVAKKAAALQSYNLGADRLAIQGYDPVAYFTQGKPEKGNPQFQAEYRGVRYQFASAEDKALFAANPQKYVPTYGGWCATAMAKGEKVEIDPTNFKVTNGRLFLFFKAFYANALDKWNKDETNLTVKADTNWKKLSGE